MVASPEQIKAPRKIVNPYDQRAHKRRNVQAHGIHKNHRMMRTVQTNVQTEEERIKEQEHQKDLERLRNFRPMDDYFIRAMLKDNIELAQFILRIVTGIKSLILTSCETQADIKRVTGAKSVCLDAYGTDDAGKKYDLEIQRDDEGADPHRARYHSSSMDIENLDEGQDFRELPDTYTIFITESDFFGMGEPFYVIRRVNETLGQPFNDGTTILYINGEYRGNDDIGNLMHDFSCSKAEEMIFPLMAGRTRYLKKTTEGVTTVCKDLEDMRNQAEARGEARGKALGKALGKAQGKALGKEEQAKETAYELRSMGMSDEYIARAVKVGVSTVSQWLSEPQASPAT